MAPKPKKTGKEPIELGAEVFTEVNHAMNQFIIADLNQKLARLRALVVEYEQKNEDLQLAYEKLDEDRSDIISYLKKSLNVKTEENIELKDRVKGLEELIEEDTQKFKRNVRELEDNFTTMKAQLSSENKLLSSKIGTLEEFKAIKDDIMDKFERQEQAFADQEMKYKRIVYDTEKKFVIGKDKLKKEMEARLLSLAQDFQDASESRIAATTHRTIRENIALNNQFDDLLFTQAKLAEQNEKLKESQIAARAALEVAESERDKAINKSIVLLKVIDQLTLAYRNVQKNQNLHQSKIQDQEHLLAKVQKLTKHNETLTSQARILEQNLHAAMDQQNIHIVTTGKLTSECNKYKKVIKEVTSAVQKALKTDKLALADPARVLDRKVILNNILSIINTHRNAVRVESIESLVSFSDVYEKGDLGFIPKPVPGFGKPPKMTSAIVLPSESPEPSKSSSVSVPSLESSVISLKTIESHMPVIPKRKEGSILSSKESIPSFTVTSLHSSTDSSKTASVDSFEALTDVEKQLALSKLEIQKSILKDLAVCQSSRLSDTRSSVDIKPSGLLNARSSVELKEMKNIPAGSLQKVTIEKDEDKGKTVEFSETEGEQADKTLKDDALIIEQAQAAIDEQAKEKADEEDKKAGDKQDKNTADEQSKEI